MRKNNVGNDLQYGKKKKKPRPHLFLIMRKNNVKEFAPFCIPWGFFIFIL
jgi:hypothetical protein